MAEASLLRAAIPLATSVNVNSVLTALAGYGEYKREADFESRAADLRAQRDQFEERRYQDALRLSQKRLELMLQDAADRRVFNATRLDLNKAQIDSNYQAGLAAAAEIRKSGRAGARAAKYRAFGQIASSLYSLVPNVPSTA